MLNLQIDPGGEKYYSLAQNKLRQLKAMMKRSGLKAFSQWVLINDSDKIFINSCTAGNGLSFDRIKIFAGGGDIVANISAGGTTGYALIKWDGSATIINTTGKPAGGYAPAASIGNNVLVIGAAGAYVVSFPSFTIVAGPLDTTSVYGWPVEAGTAFQPAAVAGVLPPQKWAVSYRLNDGTAATNRDIVFLDAALTNPSLINFTDSPNAPSTGSAGAYRLQSAAGGIYDDSGRDADPGDGISPTFTGLFSYVPSSATFAPLENHFAATSVAGRGILVSPGKALRPVDDGTGAQVEISDIATGAVLATVPAWVGGAYYWCGMCCDATRLMTIVINQAGTTVQAKVTKLDTYAQVDISAKLTASLTLAQIGRIFANGNYMVALNTGF